MSTRSITSVASQPVTLSHRPWTDGGDLLVCAGEDSGDQLLSDAFSDFPGGGGGELAKRLRGTWGFRSAATLHRAPLIPMEKLAVNGMGDVLRHAPRLLWHRHRLQNWLAHPQCRGLVGIDYPGFNVPLMQRACRLGKGRLLVAPPQIWAWKPHRGRDLRGEEVAVFFSFEQEVWEAWGAVVHRCRHPALDRLPPNPVQDRRGWMLQPGSRQGTLQRNLPLYLELARYLRQADPEHPVIFIAANPSVMAFLQKTIEEEFPVRLSSGGRALQGARGCIAVPGTSTLEAALAGCPTLVTSHLDALTWWMGKSFLRIPHLALPNLLLGERLFPEAIFGGKGVPLFQLDRLLQRPVSDFEGMVPVLRRLLDGPSLGSVVAQCAQRW